MSELHGSSIAVSERWLEGAIETHQKAGDFKKAAVYAYALARLAEKDKDESRARYFTARCLELVNQYPTDTLEQCASAEVSVAGVLIPGLFHEGTVRRDLAAFVA
ncbi:MAG: hypothetical protein HYY60_00235 [Parcubacteria group bacterium]|nr:hypothetical protein [Parcubacteria group bacterium]MBI3074944.1 hypothetical protein [Parcubacteria group bacterium]